MHRLGFFDRADTRATLQKFASTEGDWTIYVGLGGTIDRTGVTWKTLIDRMLARFESDSRIRSLVIEKSGIVQAATILESLYFSSYESKDEAVHAIQASVADILYGPQQFMKGQILERLAEYAFTLADKDRSVVFVTPNYDMYLYQELFKLYGILKKKDPSAPELRDNIVLSEKSGQLPTGWSSARQVSCVHIHGYISNGGTDLDRKGGLSRGLPVIGEYSYNASAAATKDALDKLFGNRNVLIVGSSVTDGPLVSALLESHNRASKSQSRSKANTRYALQPLQSAEWTGLEDADLQRVRRWNSERLLALGVEAIYPDFFGQVGQLVSEVQRCVVNEDAAEMTSPIYARRYTERLEAWWSRWSRKSLQSATQATHHELLAETLQQIRSHIGAPPEEGLKLELWCRWNPYPGNRELARWASSVGTWPDINGLRKDEIGLGSNFRSVQIFCAGAPRFMQAERSAVTDRWRSYLGEPISLALKNGRLPVGVISIASTRDAAPSDPSLEPSSIRASNLGVLQRALRDMADVGERILRA